MHQHAFFIEAEVEEGSRLAVEFIETELGLTAQSNPDVVILSYGLFSPEDARRVQEASSSAPLRGTKKAIVIAANRAYHEAQNALLKMFEEPAEGTHLFLILPSAGMLLPTLRSRVQMLGTTSDAPKIPESAQKFISAPREKRALIAKKLASGTDEESRRENRDEALAIVNGIEVAAYAELKKGGKVRGLLSDVATLRSFLYDRSAPIRLILEHLALVTPRTLRGRDE